tara:strand:- start:33109 stop:33318 length:210 start_codon:yes stop_codon:yes gene_type:complete
MTCQKMPFASNKQALKEIKIINAENKRWSKNRKANANKKASTYWCLECEAWHLTTMPKNVLKIKGYKKR